MKLENETNYFPKENIMKDLINDSARNNKLNIQKLIGNSIIVGNDIRTLTELFKANNPFGNMNINELSGIDSLKKTMQKITEMHVSIFTSEFMSSLTNPISKIVEQLNEINEKIINTFNAIKFPDLSELQNALKEAEENPDSVYNWMRYYDLLSEFIWIIPYRITTDELYRILENITAEKEFDKAIQKYFSKAKVIEMMNDIEKGLKGTSKNVFSQVREAYNNRYYSLCGMGLISIIDYLLSFYILNKGQPARKGIFEPIIRDMKLDSDNSKFSFIIYMLNSNINTIFEDYSFNGPLKINTNKKFRRHPVEHGKLFNNKKIDVIMLMNTLYYIILVQGKLQNYKNKLGYKKSKFVILSPKEVKKIKEEFKN